MSRPQRTRIFGFALLGLLITSLFAQQTSKRLILKDGSYQMTTQWEVKGDRVRFYSSERYDWEELPTILVDWQATEKFNRELESGESGTAPKLHETAKDKDNGERPPVEPETPPVAPGLSLPDTGGVFLLDHYQNKPQLVELEQSGGELNRHTSRNILRAAINPLALSSRQTIELEGAHAAVQAHVDKPVLYVQVDAGETPADTQQIPHPPQATQPAADRYRIVRLQSKKATRVVGDLNVALTGKMSQKESWIRTSNKRFGEWTRITPVEPLPKGEYAVVELLDKSQINLYVWDFGLDPSAPENKNAK